MTTITPSGELPITKTQLHIPDINEVASVLSTGLKVNFADVSVDVVDCPDLTKDPFNLVCPGICGKPHLLDIGGVSYLLPTVKKDKLYNLPSLCRVLNVEPAFAIGAGAGPWPHLNSNCEGVINFHFEKGKINQQSRIASISPYGAKKGVGTCKVEILPQSETRCALLANVLLSQGLSGKVLRVVCKHRIGTKDFITSIRESLIAKYEEKLIGLGGTFALLEGKSKQHIMPDFSKVPLHSNEDVENWLHFFEMSAPLISVGTLVTNDPGLDLRLHHFHTFSNHGEGGHYHFDTTPETAHYEGYFVIAETLVRVDQPPESLNFGKD